VTTPLDTTHPVPDPPSPDMINPSLFEAVFGSRFGPGHPQIGFMEATEGGGSVWDRLKELREAILGPFSLSALEPSLYEKIFGNGGPIQIPGSSIVDYLANLHGRITDFEGRVRALESRT